GAVVSAGRVVGGVVQRVRGALGGEQRGRLQVGERAAGVAAGEPDELVERLRGEGDAAAEPAFVGDGPLQHRADVVVAERFEGEQQRARQQRRDDGEGRVLGGGADEGDPAVLDGGQQRVLLSLVEAVHL